MKTQSIILLGLVSSTTTFAALPLIDANTRNGSFESGITAPWLGDVVATQDSSFASQGSWYGTLQSSPPGSSREIGFQFLTASPTDGRTFIATFDARAGAVGFDSLSVDFFSSSGGVFIGANEVPLVFPVLTSSEWRTYQVEYQLPDSWSGDGNISLQILFSKSEALSGVTYVGYLDNVTLLQVPEPSTTALLGLAGLFAMGCLGVRKPCPIKSIQRMRAGRLAQLQFARSRRLALTADARRSMIRK